MAKRFTDTNKWKKRFIKNLSSTNKLFFLYILDDCDHAGIWHVEPEIASIRIGTEVDIDNAKKELGKHIVEFDHGEKWFIPYFIEFQYGELHENNRAHNSVLKILDKYKIKPLVSPLQGCKDMDMDKDMDKDKDKDSKIYFEYIWNLYDKKVGDKRKLKKKWDKLKLSEQQECETHIPLYIKSQPDKTYRKNFETYLNNRSWEDEIIIPEKKLSKAEANLKGLMEA